MTHTIKVSFAEVDGDNAIILTAIEALCARLCHDLSGPLAGVKAGAELLKEDSNSELLALTLRSIEELSRLLIWLRSALAGSLAPTAGASFSEAIRSVRQWLAEGRITLGRDIEEISKQFFHSQPELECIFAKIFPLMVADIHSMLPRGGTLSLHFCSGKRLPCLRLVFEGPRATIQEDWMKVSSGDFSCLSQKTIIAFIIALQAKRLGLELTVIKPDANVIELAAVLRPQP